MALWEIMPQSVHNEQRNGTARLNDSKMAATGGVWTPSTVYTSLNSLAKALHN